MIRRENFVFNIDRLLSKWSSDRLFVRISIDLVWVTRRNSTKERRWKKGATGPKAVRAREEIGTVVVQLCLIGGETPTNAHTRSSPVERDIARHELFASLIGGNARQRFSTSDRRESFTRAVVNGRKTGNFYVISERSVGKSDPLISFHRSDQTLAIRNFLTNHIK